MNPTLKFIAGAVVLVVLALALAFRTALAFWWAFVPSLVAAAQCRPGARALDVAVAEWRRRLSKIWNFRVASHEGHQLDRPVIYLLNHPVVQFGAFDHLILAFLRRKYCIVLQHGSLWIWKVFKELVIDSCDPVWVTFRGKNQYQTILAQYRQRIRKKLSIAIFPERHSDNLGSCYKLRSLKRGPFAMATELGVPVVYGVLDPFVAMHAWMDTASMPCHIFISAPISPADFPNVDAFQAHVQAAMQAQLDRFARSHNITV
jgi:1-acyl-sn-glycerol-3-phosphate acyltransferase